MFVINLQMDTNVRGNLCAETDIGLTKNVFFHYLA